MRKAQELGMNLHQSYNPLKNIDNADALINQTIGNTRLRPDVLLGTTVYELKPFSTRNLRKGLKQAAHYAEVASNGNASGWTLVIDMYVKP